MYFKRFNIGDAVSYKGKRFHKDLFGKRGVVVSRVQNENSGVVVDFGLEDSFLLDENVHLARFHGKTEEEKAAEGKDTKTPEVQKKRAGRRVVSQVSPSETDGE